MKNKLIDVALPLEAVNKESARSRLPSDVASLPTTTTLTAHLETI
jgi:adenine-specific DNA methylase